MEKEKAFYLIKELHTSVKDVEMRRGFGEPNKRSLIREYDALMRVFSALCPELDSVEVHDFVKRIQNV